MSVRGLTGRLRATWLSLGLALSGLGALVFFAALVISLVLSLVGVGLVLWRPLVPWLDAWGTWWRRRVGQWVDREIPGSVRPVAGEAPLRTQLAVWARDPVRWRTVGHVGFCGTAGWMISAIAVLAPVGALAASLVAVLVTNSTPTRALLVIAAVGCLLIWWWATPVVVAARAALDATILGGTRASQLERRVAEVTRTRAESLDLAAAELRRVERDLHDGAQARLVSLAMNLGLARELLDRDRDAAAELLAEASRTTTAALDDLRAVVRDIRPPVLADRGLVGAVRALALDLALPVTVTAEVPDRLPDPIESAVYFAVAELLANAVKHSGSERVFVDLAHTAGWLTVTVVDDGHGGASIGSGTGLAGIERRLAAFDGVIRIESPDGGPTRVRVEVPCESSSPRTTRS